MKLLVDVKILNNTPPWFIKRVIEEGRILLEKTPLMIEKLYLRALDEISLSDAWNSENSDKNRSSVRSIKEPW